MKIKNRIITIVIAVVLTIITCIPIFAVNNNEDYIKIPPEDLGTKLTASRYYEGYYKFYIKIDLTQLNATTQIEFRRFYTDGSTNTTGYNLYWDGTHITFDVTNQISNNYSFIVLPIINTDITNATILYIPCYGYNAGPFTGFAPNFVTPQGIDYYISNTTDINIIAQEAFNVGYENGYYNGFNEAIQNGIEHYTNITGYVTQLLTQFVGSDAAQYITPIAIVLVILFVYFLFIRFLLSLIKAKGVIKTCDIVMVVASILILIVMYAPMLNITINKNIRTDTIETSETTQLRRTEYVYDEYGRIIAGPGGTIVYDEVESTTSEQEQTEVEVTTQPIEKEITTYEETKENIVRS